MEVRRDSDIIRCCWADCRAAARASGLSLLATVVKPLLLLVFNVHVERDVSCSLALHVFAWLLSNFPACGELPLLPYTGCSGSPWYAIWSDLGFVVLALELVWIGKTCGPCVECWMGQKERSECGRDEVIHDSSHKNWRSHSGLPVRRWYRHRPTAEYVIKRLKTIGSHLLARRVVCC